MQLKDTNTHSYQRQELIKGTAVACRSLNNEKENGNETRIN